MEWPVWLRWINVALILIPVVIFRDVIFQGFFHLDEAQEAPIVLILAALTLFPLSSFLDSAVEGLEALFGEFIGGLLHATFGNAAELAIALTLLLALPAGNESATILVLSSVAGVVIRNSLLILGVATMAGTAKHGRLRFSAESAAEYSSFFALAVTGLCLPTAAFFVARASNASFDAADLKIFGHYSVSLGVGAALLVAYVAYILYAVFRLRNGSNLQGGSALATAEMELQEDEEDREHKSAATRKAEAKREARQAREPKTRVERAAASIERFVHKHDALRVLFALSILALAAVGIVYMSEAFAGSVETLGRNFEAIINPFFLGLIVIPVVGGMVELIDCISMAREKKIEIVMGVTAGASIQMVTVVVPVLVIVGYLTNHPLLLNFNPLEVIIFVAASFLFMLLSRDGESTILEGVQLVSLWALLAATAYFLPPHVG